jgi:hypothetical protein
LCRVIYPEEGLRCPEQSVAAHENTQSSKVGHARSALVHAELAQ